MTGPEDEFNIYGDIFGDPSKKDLSANQDPTFTYELPDLDFEPTKENSAKQIPDYINRFDTLHPEIQTKLINLLSKKIGYGLWTPEQIFKEYDTLKHRNKVILLNRLFKKVFTLLSVAIPEKLPLFFEEEDPPPQKNSLVEDLKVLWNVLQLNPIYPKGKVIEDDANDIGTTRRILLLFGTLNSNSQLKVFERLSNKINYQLPNSEKTPLLEIDPLPGENPLLIYFKVLWEALQPLLKRLGVVVFWIIVLLINIYWLFGERIIPIYRWIRFG